MQLLTQETVSYLFHHHGLRNIFLDSLMRKSNLTYNNNVLKERLLVNWRKLKKLLSILVSLTILTNCMVKKVQHLKVRLILKEETTSVAVETSAVEVTSVVEI